MLYISALIVKVYQHIIHDRNMMNVRECFKIQNYEKKYEQFSFNS